MNAIPECRCAIKLRLERQFKEDILGVMKSEVKRQKKPLEQIDFEAGFTEGYFRKLLKGKRNFSFTSIYCYAEVLGFDLVLIPKNENTHKASNNIFS